jgi:hypothetical protein
MPETVKLPGVGPVKKTWVYVGGALIVGIVGYAYFSRATGGGGGEDLEPSPGVIPEDYGEFAEDRYPPPTSVGSGSVDDFGAGSIINTNTEWFAAALSGLADAGYEPLNVAATLGKFLSRQGLSADEKVVIQAAKGMVGEPPQGGPWPIIDQLPPPPTTTPPPAGTPTKLAAPVLRYSAGSAANTNYMLAWTRVDGAAYYILKRELGPGSPTSIGVIGLSRRTPPLKRRYTYQYRVRAISATPGKASSDWSSPVRFKVP